MGCDDKNQSAISEVRDQLFLDTADGVRLDVVTGNLGLDRPYVTMGDDEWRAAAKAIALQPKLVATAFQKLIEICVGPMFARVGTLAEAASKGDPTLTVLDGSVYVQTGTIVIDPGLSTEETVKFCIRDAQTGEFILSTTLTQPHSVIAPGSGRLAADAAKGATTLQLADSSKLPTSGFPYPLMVDRGTLSEELVTVSANNTGTNVLTVSALASAHAGPTPLRVVSQVAVAAPAKRTFLVLPDRATRVFPQAGYVRINHGGAHDEVAHLTDNDVENNVLYFDAPLAFAHAAGEAIELVTAGASVDVAQVVQLGVHWQMGMPGPRQVQVVIPRNLSPLSLLDATWMHDATPSTTPTTLAANAASTDQYLILTAAGGLPGAGLIQVNGGTIYFYDTLFAQTDVAKTSASSAVGATSIGYTPNVLPTGLTENFIRTSTPFAVTINPGGGTEETVTVIDAATDASRLVFASGLAHAHSSGETIRLRTQVLLGQEVGATYSSGATVAFFPTNYAGTSLDDGNIRGGSPGYDYRLDHFAGGYIYDSTQRGVSAVSSSLTTALLPAVRVAYSQGPGFCCLEVDDLSLWPAPAFTPFAVQVGSEDSLFEQQTVISTVLRGEVTATVASSTSVGATAIPFTLTGAAQFPQGDGANPAGYRILVGSETLVVNYIDTVSSVIHLYAPATASHASSEAISIFNDILTVGPLAYAHAGPTYNPSRLGEPIQQLVGELLVGSVTGFQADGGYAWVNFGQEVLGARSDVTSVTDSTHIVLRSTANFPTANYPYQVIVREGKTDESRHLVTSNNALTNTLTLAVGYAAAVGDYIRLPATTPESFEYSATQASPPAIIIDPPVVLAASGHRIGERVMYSPAVSESNPDGSSFGFKLPPDPTACVTALLELARSAGVQVSVIER